MYFGLATLLCRSRSAWWRFQFQLSFLSGKCLSVLKQKVMSAGWKERAKMRDLKQKSKPCEKKFSRISFLKKLKNVQSVTRMKLPLKLDQHHPNNLMSGDIKANLFCRISQENSE